MVRRLTVLLVVVVGCADQAPSFGAFLEQDAKMPAGTGSAGEATSSGTSSTPGATSGDEGSGSASGDVSNGATVEPEPTTTTTDDATTTAADAELVPPQIVAVDMPAEVHIAGPVAVAVTVEHASEVRGTLDGVALAPFEDQGGGVWLGTVPIFGTPDNGDHVVQVTATNGPLADTWPPVAFTVKTPAPGGHAWAAVWPQVSTTRRAAVTPDGDLIEVGAVEVDGVMKPSIRKRSAANGSELWPAKTIVLDTREGSADAVAVRADGHMWVAMNVKNANLKWQPRIVMLDGEGHAVGVEPVTEPGPSVRGIAVTDDGGFFAVGFGGSGFGDMDVVYWRVTGENVATASAETWDYWPTGQKGLEHTFDDLAFDVVVGDGAAWVVGASTGDHEGLPNKTLTRGIVVRLEVETGALLGPATVAQPVNAWRHSMFLAGARHPDGVIVTGNEGTDDGTTQRITVQAFDAAGALTYHKSEWSAPVAYGTGVAWSAHGVALAAGVVHDGDMLRGLLYGRGPAGSNFDYLFPGTEPSAANGMALDAYDQVYVVGERTLGGERQARAARIHQ